MEFWPNNLVMRSMNTEITALLNKIICSCFNKMKETKEKIIENKFD